MSKYAGRIMESTIQLPEPGMVFHNYKALCAYLNEPVLTGGSKIRQLAFWRERFSFEQHGHKLTIVPFTETTHPYFPRFKWKDVIDPQIIIRLIQAMQGFGLNQASSDLKELILYNSEAFVHLGLCNPHYSKLREGDLDCNVDIDSQQEYYDKSYTRLRRIYYSALERLHESRYIYYVKRYLRPHPPMILTDKEEARVELHKSNILTEMGFANERAVCRTNRRFEFYKTLKLLIKTDPKLGYDSLYSVNRIFFTEESIRQVVPYFTQLYNAQSQNEYKKETNDRSLAMHLQLFNESPFEELTNLVILTPDTSNNQEQHNEL